VSAETPAAPAVPFVQFLRERFASGGFTTEDILASMLPLLREVAGIHELGNVAPLNGAQQLGVDGFRLVLASQERLEPKLNRSAVERVGRPASLAFEVMQTAKVTVDADSGVSDTETLSVAAAGEALTEPKYLVGYRSWEHELDHHDPLTDNMVLGLVLASLACGLDLSIRDDADRFARSRRNLFALNPKINPVIAQAVLKLTELDRSRRARDLGEIVRFLETYRDQDIDFDLDLRRAEAARGKNDKRTLMLERLRERLFEISRRNRLLHHRSTQQTLNMTVASVPALFDVRSIRPEQLLFWHPEIERILAQAKPLQLGRYLRFEDAPYLPGVLDGIMADARRDQAEIGFSQLRLVICFLRWHNLKEDPHERIDSPLLLLPVAVTKKKGIRDSYVLQPLSREAEVNPVLRYHLKELYGIEMPESVELADDAIGGFHELLAAAIRKSEPGVSLLKVEKPHVEMIYERAQRRLDQYRRRLRPERRRVTQTWRDLDYSYRRERYQPLGIQIFQAMVLPPPAPMREIVDRNPRPRNFMVPEGEYSGRERSVVALHESTTGNPYSWDFDLCNVTLGNFRYRKMSLVRDYNALLEGGHANPAFDAVFSLAPRADAVEAPVLGALDQYPIVDCDPTQSKAIALARTGTSYIIQGPPGTGKSQTITNLIADFVARDKRVLFVCEKRAALDVVFHRLKQQKLDVLSSLIHDSQSDKKEFIQDLKATYEGWLQHDMRDSGSPEAARRRLLDTLDIEMRPLRDFDDAMRTGYPGAGIELRSLLHRAVALSAYASDLDAGQRSRIPLYRYWVEHGAALRRVESLQKNLPGAPIFARHPLRRLSPQVSAVTRPRDAVEQKAAAAAELAGRITRAFDELALPAESRASLESVKAIGGFSARVERLTRMNVYDVVDPRSGASERLRAEGDEVARLERQLEELRELNRPWKEKLQPADTATALDLARGLERSITRFFSGAYWSLRKLLNARYDFASQVVKPSWTQVLSRLDEEHRVAASIAERARLARTHWGAEGGIEAFVSFVEELRASIVRAPEPVRQLHARLLASERPDVLLSPLLAAGADLDALDPILESIFADHQSQSLEEVVRDLGETREALNRLGEVLPILEELALLPEPLQLALRSVPVTMPELEAASADRTIEEIFARDTALAQFGALARERHLDAVAAAYREWRKENGRFVRDRARTRFLRNVSLSASPSAQLSREESAFKKRYATGRRELEHELGKTMRYRSIRDLVAGPSGDVILDLKPVWLMSPLSVSDTLPLEAGKFDVVIFDEASQIPLEEAIPAIFRANQIIVVGDEMQLPPTSFFTAKQAGDEEGVVSTDEGELVALSLDSDSFLNHATRNLASTMLGWHYRSRSESLISFSNASFYGGRLLTVPDRRVPSLFQHEIVVQHAESGFENAGLLLERSVSFHFMERGVYESRRNITEAFYVAQMVRGLLARGGRESIAVVAFSEAQQGEIERALGVLAASDPDFSSALDAEYEREEDGQFSGLIVKNLENIQGDERDVVILSVCYGHAPDGKLLMNFGPINQNGGEKRLNVAFSRARKHMALVSSIRHQEIRNTYNDGANALRRYLHYASAVSRGDMGTAEVVLRESLKDSPLANGEIEADQVGDQIADALRAEGFEVDRDIGQSHFRCNLAVREAADRFARLAVLIDTEAHYRQRDILERDVLRPSILRSFDWRVAHVLTKDWYESREAVLARLIRVLREAPASIDVSGAEPSSDPAGAHDVAIATEPVAELGEDAAAGNTAAEPDTGPEADSPVASMPNTGDGVEPGGGKAATTIGADVLPIEFPVPDHPEARAAFRSAEVDEFPVPRVESPRATVVPAGKSRRFELVDGNSNKYWEIVVSGAEHTVRFGRIGTDGQAKTKSFGSTAEAEGDAAKLVREKLRKGYVEV